MKKRLPILIVIFGALSLFLILKFSGGQPVVKDSDRDGFPDEIDKCDDVPSSVNNGCPEAKPKVPAYNPDDRDGDGYSPDAMDASQHDDNDNDPCIPNKTCDICDEDGDKLTRKEELAKGTKVNVTDTDGDGLSDKADLCATRSGFSDKNGCPLTMDIGLNRLKKEGNNFPVEWNSELASHIISGSLTVTRDNTGELIFSEAIITGQNRALIPYNSIPSHGEQYTIRIQIDGLQDRDKIILSGATAITKSL